MKKLIGLFLAVAMLCMAFPSTVFADYHRILKSYTDMGEFVYVDPELGVECRASAQWAITYIDLKYQMTAPKSDITRMLTVEIKSNVYWEHGGSEGGGRIKPSVEADRYGGGMAGRFGLGFRPNGRSDAFFVNYIIMGVQFYADDVLVCECTFDKMAYTGLYND